jgi:hypothetical protein
MGGLVGGLLLSSGVRPVFFLAALLLVSSGFLARRLPNSPSATSSTASG